ncbi:MAG: hypothetical protein E3J41_00575 [Candidatus Cloacimonadota bacterium]|nr:MAG: hypothetical protein E3J41_00575 [Candidatus Cloacimonadota bacterium]
MKKNTIIRCALESGIALSTAHGQSTLKLCPISDVATLEVFAAGILKESGTADMLAMLEELEWSTYQSQKGVQRSVCPCCLSARFDHAEDCKLGNLLKRIKGDKLC